MASTGLRREELLPNILDDIKLSENLFREDRVLEAYKLLNNIEKFVKSLDVRTQTTVGTVITKSDVVGKIRAAGDNLTSLLKLINDDEGWNVWSASIGMNQDITVSTHRDEKRGEYYFKIEGIVRCDVLFAITAILENDMYQFWLPLCTRAECLLKVSRHRRIMKTKFDFTLLKKESLLNTHADILQDGSVFLSVQPVTPAEERELGLTSATSAATQPSSATPSTPMTYDGRILPTVTATDTQHKGGVKRSPLSRMDISGGILIRSADSESAKQAGEKRQNRESLNSPLDPASTLSSYEQLCGRVATAAVNLGGMSSAECGGMGYAADRDQYRGSGQHPLQQDTTTGSGGGIGSGSAKLKSGTKGGEESKDNINTFSSTKARASCSPGRVPGPGPASSSPFDFTRSTPMSFDIDNESADDEHNCGGGGGGRDWGEADGPPTEIVAVFKMDPHLDFVPDWIFTMAVRSAISTMIPMLEFQAKQFDEDGAYGNVLVDNSAFYNDIERRLNEYRKK